MRARNADKTARLLARGKLNELRRLAEVVSLGGEPWLRPFLEGASALSGACLAGTYAVEVEGDERVLHRCTGAGMTDAQAGRVAARVVRPRPPGTLLRWDPQLVPRAQRNRVFSSEALVRRGYTTPEVLQRLSGVFREETAVRVGEQARVLVCRGATLLLFMGWYRPEGDRGFDARELSHLAALVPAAARRLSFDERLARLPLLEATVQGALDALGGPAWVVAHGGRVVATNGAGREALDRRRTDTRAALCAAVARGGDDELQVVELRGRGLQRLHLVVAHGEGARDAARLAWWAREWRLTAAEQRVLEGVVGGASNAAIARDRGVSVRSVELHVSHLFDKAGVESRAALLARFFRAR